MAGEEGEPWVIVDLLPGVQAVRFTQPALLESGDGAVFRGLWDRILEEDDTGRIVILNFQRVEFHNSYFLARLFLARKELHRRGGMFIGCHLCDVLLSLWKMPGRPLDFVLNYVSSEAEAVEKARLLRGGT